MVRFSEGKGRSEALNLRTTSAGWPGASSCPGAWAEGSATGAITTAIRLSTRKASSFELLDFGGLPGVCSESVKPWAHTLATCVDRYYKHKTMFGLYMRCMQQGEIGLHLQVRLESSSGTGPILSNKEVATSSRLAKQRSFLVGAAASGSTVEQGS